MALMLTQPLFWLIFLAVVALLISLARPLRWWPPAIFMRAGIVFLVLVATLAPNSRLLGGALPERQVLIVDQSESLDEGMRQMLQAVAQNWHTNGVNRLVVVFGDTAQVWEGLNGPWPQVDGRASDLVGALTLSAELLGNQPGEVVLATDGLVPSSSAVSEAFSALAAAGHTLNVSPIAPAQFANDLYLGDFRAPASMWQGAAFAVLLPVYAPADGEAIVRLTVDGQVSEEQPQALRAGENLVAFPLTAVAQGIMTLEASVDWLDDPRLENNRVYMAIEVFPPPRVLMVTRDLSTANPFRQSLLDSGMQTDLYDPADLPTELDRLTPYQVVIMHNLLAEQLTLEQMLALRAFVSQLGRGLLVLGGRNAYTLGGYENTPIEEILPVKLEPPLRSERPPITFVVVLDRSGSMNDDPGPVKPIDFAKEAAIRVVENLRPEDHLAVVSYSADVTWDVPLQQLGDGLGARLAQDAITRIEASGGTHIYEALRMVVEEMERSAPTEAVHILLLSDGNSEDGSPGEFRTLARRARLSDMSISTIFLGDEGDPETLREIAEASDGRFFQVEEASDLPEVMVAESRAAHSENIQLGQTGLVAGTENHPILGGFSLSSLPTLRGYNALSSRADEGAEDVLLSSGFGDPILSVWQVGLGRVAAWTSDIGEEWGIPWQYWGERGQFWAQVIRYMLPDPSFGPAQAEINLDTRSVHVELRVLTGGGVPYNLADAQYSFVAPEGVVTYSIPQVAPGLYRLSFPRPPEGAYRGLVSYLGLEGAAEVGAPFAVNYPQEWRPADAEQGRENLLTWAAMTGGVELQLESLASPSETVGDVRDPETFWPLLLALVFLWPVEIALRRRWLPWR